ncbi:unnamed protein product [Rotaria magnacalcarata]|uniref:TMEM205-like domain-containing protein n=1 Tax=Rotaria magnacalcarata TaxID=392030 RepID=A0A816N1F6_9BILA|nr:unnamed protein product [Rotaria magnacalcarata]CAF1463213.1 unnamed protein product [Rotaria magnacalcarata]CAF2011954.1 unnamed protein product [Rotaria magnacalcarata]CAF2101655.1 unnamed protein product [Rotaria magnacalcarata]CAF3850781.1 unnamed protein product [Rotaria magnacalcarata]
MGSQISKIEDNVQDFYKKTWPQAWYLAPSFLTAIGAVGYVGYAFSQTKAVPSSSNISFLHLVGVAGGFGISFWITAVHGRAIQRMLTRHEFATVQSHLSSVYFASSTILSSLSLSTFLLRHPVNTWSKEAKHLGIALFVALAAAELNTLILNPLVTNLMFDRNNIEFLQAAKTTEDIDRLHRDDQKYRLVNNKFDLFHSISMVSGLVYHGVQWYHLFFLADKCLSL